MSNLLTCGGCGSNLDDVKIQVINETSVLTCPTCKARMELSAQLLEPGNAGGAAPGGEEPVGEMPSDETPEAGAEGEAPAGEGGEIPDELQIMPKGESKERGGRVVKENQDNLSAAIHSGLDADPRPQEVATGLNSWVGLDCEFTKPMIECLVWALAQDQELDGLVQDMVREMREALNDEMERNHPDDEADDSIEKVNDMEAELDNDAHDAERHEYPDRPERQESRLREGSDKKEWTGNLAGFSAKMLGIGVDLGLEAPEIDDLIARLTEKEAVEIKDDEIKVTFKKVRQVMMDFLKEKNPMAPAAAPQPAPEPAPAPEEQPPADSAPVGTPPPADAPAPDAIAEPSPDLGSAVAKAGDAKPAGESKVTEALASPERIKKLAYRAAYDRVNGRINDAMRFEQAVDSFVSQMEKAGRGDEARDAEVEGQEAGQADAQDNKPMNDAYTLMAEAKDEVEDPAEKAEEEIETKVDRLLSKYFESIRMQTLR